MQQNQNTVLLNGIGGMGKSELLNKWVHDVAVKNKLYNSIVYISCTNGIANALENNSEVAQALGIQPDNPNKLAAAKVALHQLNNLLLVLDDLPWQEQPYKDNINHVNDLRKLAQVVATSRRTYANFKPIPVPALDDDKAIKLFKNHFEPELTHSCDDAIKQIIKRAGRHTLTIEILAKTASEHEWSATKLLETLKDNDFNYETLKTNVEYTKSGKHAEETLHKALAKLFDISELTDEQKHILFHLSCMDSQAFTIKAVTTWLAVETPAIKKLIKLGWIQPTQKTNNIQFYQLHQTITHAVQTTFHNTTPAKERVASMLPVLQAMQADYQPQTHKTLDTACLSCISSYAIAGLKSTPLEPEDIKRAVVSHILIFSVFLIKQGIYALGITLLEAAKKPIKTHLGENHPDYAVSLNNLAALYESMGEYAQALPLYKQDIAITKAQLGENHPDYATSLNNLAGLYENMGEYGKALPLYEQALAIRKTQLGENHPSYASSLNNLALLYRSMGEDDQALPLFEQALTIVKTQLGETHPSYANSLNNLALLYRSMGKDTQALPLYKQALAIRKSKLGENHPDYAQSLNNLAGLYYHMGKYGKALPLYEQAIGIATQALGEAHPHTQTMLKNYNRAKNSC